MENKLLHELAKFASGLVVGDFLCGWWLATHNEFPFSFLGITFTSDVVAPWMVFDIALFIILVYYGWHLGNGPAMQERTFLLAIGIIFGIVTLVHLIRIFTGADLAIFGWHTPLWISWIGAAIGTFLSYMSFHLAATLKK